MSEIDTSREDAQFNLGELLAVIHRDGGHYQHEHGDSKATADAMKIVSTLLSERDALQGQIDAMRKDAARYAWVRRQGMHFDIYDEQAHYNGETLDTAIDAAIAGVEHER